MPCLFYSYIRSVIRFKIANASCCCCCWLPSRTDAVVDDRQGITVYRDSFSPAAATFLASPGVKYIAKCHNIFSVFTFHFLTFTVSIFSFSKSLSAAVGRFILPQVRPCSLVSLPQKWFQRGSLKLDPFLDKSIHRLKTYRLRQTIFAVHVERFSSVVSRVAFSSVIPFVLLSTPPSPDPPVGQLYSDTSLPEECFIYWRPPGNLLSLRPRV